MSTAMMSAPSSANRTAWARPWPRAAPVMKATLFANCVVIQTPWDDEGLRLTHIAQPFLGDVRVCAGVLRDVEPLVGPLL